MAIQCRRYSHHLLSDNTFFKLVLSLTQKNVIRERIICFINYLHIYNKDNEKLKPTCTTNINFVHCRTISDYMYLKEG